MKHRLLILGVLLVVGCTEQPTSLSSVDQRGRDVSGNPSDYTVLTEPPDAALDRMASAYPTGNEEFRQRWVADAAASAMDGQRTIEILEKASYADVICHRIEYPLRVATLDYIRAKIDEGGVADALRWIRTSYQSRLPLETPGDEAGQLRGILVQSMQIRMREYAEELLTSEASTRNRK